MKDDIHSFNLFIKPKLCTNHFPGRKSKNLVANLIAWESVLMEEEVDGGDGEKREEVEGKNITCRQTEELIELHLSMVTRGWNLILVKSDLILSMM